MGGLISVILSVLAAIAFYGTGHSLSFWLCVVIVVLSFWSWGVMHNYAMNSAKARGKQEHGSHFAVYSRGDIIHVV